MTNANEVKLKFAIEGGKVVSYEIDGVRIGLEKMGIATESAGGKARAAFDQTQTAANAARQAIAAAENSTISFISSLERQVSLYGKSATEALRYDAALLGMTRSQREHVDSLLQTAAAQEEASKKTTSVIEGIAKAAASLWSVDKLYEYGKEMALLNARYETLGVSMAVVGKNSGYTSEQMDAAAAAMQRSGISMTESRQQAMRLVQAHIDLADSQKLARIAQDAAVIGNMNSSEAFAAMIHGISTGQPEVLRTIGLNVSMEQSYKVMAATLGKHVDQLTQNEKTQGILNAVMLAGQDIAGTYEAAMDTAGKQINSMKRYTEDLKTVQGEVFNDVLTAGVMAFTEHMKDANVEAKALSANKELKAWGEGITDMLAAVADNANNAYQALKILALTGAMVNAMGDTTPLDFAGRSAIMEGYNADVAAALAAEDRFSKALDERRKTVAEKTSKALADTLSKDAAYTTAMNAYSQQRAAGLMTEAQYVKTVQSVYQSMYGDNHEYRDTLATTPKASAVSEYQKLMVAIQGKTAAQQQEADQDQKLNDADKLRQEWYGKIDDGILKLTTSQKLALDAAIDEYDTSIKLNAAHAAAEKATLAASEAHEKYVSSLATGLDKLKAEVVAQQEANDRLGLSKQAIADLDATKLDSQAVTLELLAIKTLDKNLDEAQYNLYMAQAKVLRDQASLKRQGAIKEANIESAKSALAEWTKAADQIGQSLTDQIMTGGKSAADYITNLFRTMVLRPVVQAVVSTAVGSFASAATAGQTGTSGNSLSAAANISSLYDTLSGGFTKLSATVSGSLQHVADWMSTSNSDLLAKLGDTLGTHVSTISSVAGYAAGAAAGLAVGNAISGNFGSSNTVTAGTVLGSVLGGPIGGAIGGAIGGLINRAFGMGDTELTAQGTRGTFSSAGSFSGTNYASYHQDGGWFSSDKNWTNTSAIDPATVTAWESAFAGVKQSVTSMATSLGLSTDKITAYSKYIDVAAGTTSDQMTALFTSMADDMAAAAAPAIASFAKTGETASVTLDRLATDLTAVNQWIVRLDKSALSLSLSSGDAAAKLVDLFGSVDAFTSSTKTYYETYFTEAERNAQTTADVAKALALVGVALPTSKDGFRDIVSALDLTTDAGRNTYAVMMAVAPEFATVADAATAATETINKAFVTLFDDVGKTLDTLLSNIASARSSVADAVATVNPTQMTLSQIKSGIADASVSLPSNSALVAAANAQTAAAAKVDSTSAALKAAQSASAAASATVGTANTKMATDLATYKAKVSELYALASSGGYAVNSSQISKGAISMTNTAYQYNPATNRFADWGYDSYNSYAGLASIGAQKSQTGAIATVLDQANPTMAADEKAIAAATSALAKATDATNAAASSASAAATAQTAADAAAKQAATDYAAAMQAYAGDAEKATTKLNTLREQTVAYYQAQEALANQMTTSAANLRAAVTSISTSELDPAALTAQKQQEFAQYYSLALSTSGADKAAYADKMTAALPALSDAIKATSTLHDWALATARLAAQSNTVAGQLDAAASVDYQAESLAALQSIDATLAGLEAGTNTASGIISAAVAAGADLTAAGLRNVVQVLGGTPKFAGGGYHSGGARWVGENGPELELTGPSMIYNASQLRGLAGSGASGGSGSNADLIAEIKALREEVAALRKDNTRENTAIASHAALTADATRRMDKNGVLVYTDPAEPLKTQVAA